MPRRWRSCSCLPYAIDSVPAPTRWARGESARQGSAADRSKIGMTGRLRIAGWDGADWDIWTTASTAAISRRCADGRDRRSGRLWSPLPDHSGRPGRRSAPLWTRGPWRLRLDGAPSDSSGRRDPILSTPIGVRRPRATGLPRARGTCGQYPRHLSAVPRERQAHRRRRDPPRIALRVSRAVGRHARAEARSRSTGWSGPATGTGPRHWSKRRDGSSSSGRSRSRSCWKEHGAWLSVSMWPPTGSSIPSRTA